MFSAVYWGRVFKLSTLQTLNGPCFSWSVSEALLKRIAALLNACRWSSSTDRYGHGDGRCGEGSI